MNGVKQGMKEAQDTGQTWNMLNDTFRPRVPKVAGQVAKQAKGVMDGYMGKEQSFADVWGSSSQEQRAEWTQGPDGGPATDRALAVWKRWNEGQIDGMKHNSTIREVMDALSSAQMFVR